jgi:intracellular sulfur oxidation DsrE/DsrF family protein
MRKVGALFAACGLAALATLATPSDALAQADRRERVVYHFSEGVEQASRGLEYIRNHLEVQPNAQIVVVAHAAGVDFLMQGARTKLGNDYRTPIEDLSLQGVKFAVCEITLRERNLQRSRFVAETTFVPSGVAEITRLQQREGYAYLKP